MKSCQSKRDRDGREVGQCERAMINGGARRAGRGGSKVKRGILGMDDFRPQVRALDLGSSSSAFMHVLDTNLVDYRKRGGGDCVWCQNCGFKLALNPLEGGLRTKNEMVRGQRAPFALLWVPVRSRLVCPLKDKNAAGYIRLVVQACVSGESGAAEIMGC
eukprot:scaffold97749_cov29-Cyclotella_meneghiniana.AAC.2